jgi:hypothetical protein
MRTVSRSGIALPLGHVGRCNGLDVKVSFIVAREDDAVTTYAVVVSFVGISQQREDL